jgi:hypothetical protein
MLFMETLNTNSIKDKNRDNYFRSHPNKRQDHGTKGTSRIDTYVDDEILARRRNVKQNVGGPDEYFGPDSLNELIYEAEPTAEELENISRWGSDIDPDILEELEMAELMSSNDSVSDLAILSLRNQRHRKEQQAVDEAR